MADFTSSLYLGLHHPSHTLPGWGALTTGAPAVLGGPPGAATVAARLASLAGAERATLVRSTLHGLGDGIEVLTRPAGGLIVDAGIYPVGRWAAERAAGAGVVVRWVPHHDVGAAAGVAGRMSGRGLRPVVLADGLCTGCGRSYPLAAVAAALDPHEGRILLDDTQALGLLGTESGPAAPYGYGGGGSVRRSDVAHEAVVTVSSLAKAFGAPVASLAGTAGTVAAVRTTGSAVHAGPPSAVDVAAAAAALAVNARYGDALRARLARRVRMLRAGTAAHGLTLRGGMLPVQSTPVVGPDEGRRLLRHLDDGGVRAVLRRACGGGTAVTLVVTVAHRRAEIDDAARLLGACWARLAGAVRDAR
jgi:8-amino-7-oxononanoate synthase